MSKYGRLLTLAVPLTIAAGSWGALAGDSDQGDRDRVPVEETLILQKLIDVGGTGLGAFDISFVDPAIGLYVLSDRTNASVDVLSSQGASFLYRIPLSGVGSACPAGNPAPHFCFQGVVLNPPVPPATVGTANNNLSGPDGVVIVGHKEIWAGDGDSRIKVIDIATKQFITTISTGGKFRVDEMAYDPRDHLLAAANNADSPPFITIFDTNTKAIMGNPLVFQKGSVNADVDAQNGIEQSQWSPATGLFYVAVPQVGSDPTVGGVSVIDPSSMKVTKTFLVSNCSPAGLALGPNNEALIGCSAAFGTPATTQSVMINITNGAVVGSVPIGGNDEVWYDKGTKHYFLAARSNLSGGKADPILGSIDAITHKLDPSASTSTTAHSVAADKDSHYVFVPIGFVPPGSATGTDPTNPCPKNGCIAVYKAHSEPSDDDRFSNR
jgi:hypothetical protein